MTVHHLPPPPTPEPRPDRDLTKCAPKFRERVWTLVNEHTRRGHDPIVFEAVRSDARQAWLFRLGRDYTIPGDDRGIVTNASDGRLSWHRYGLAVDILSKKSGWPAPETKFALDLRELALEIGLTSGMDWNRNGVPVGLDPAEHRWDGPHIQWYTPGMPVSPGDHEWELLTARGPEAVWRELGAM